MIKYRIYTEDINRNDVLCLLNRYFQGYTILSASGVWLGVSEASIVIEYITESENIDYTDLKIQQVCNEIKILNKQQDILYTREDIVGVLISDDTYFR